jgi:Fe-S cluster assembly iron-binding protein IscA
MLGKMKLEIVKGDGNMKKLICLLLAIVMLTAALPVATAATVKGFEYRIVNGKAIVTGYMGSASRVTVPSTIQGYPVTTIGESAFNMQSNVKQVTIPSGVTRIEEYAFAGMDGLTSITLPSSLTTIGERAFYNCFGLKEITIPGSVTAIGSEAFYECQNLKTIIIRSSVVTIGKRAFGYCLDWETDQPYKSYGVMMKGYADSTAQSYAKKTDIQFVTLKHTHTFKTKNAKATLTKNGLIGKVCAHCGKPKGTVIRHPKTFTLSYSVFTYNGKVKTPFVTVKDTAGNTLKKNTHYTVTYQSGRKLVGTYKVTIKMKGNYTGTKTLYFNINPAGTTVSKLTKGNRKITATISKKSLQVSGYQVQYSTSKKFTSAKTKTLTSYKTTKTTLSGLKAKTTYYVRVRTYKKVNGKTYYSKWSNYKYTKTQ